MADAQSAGPQKHRDRVKRACEQCQFRKTKCNGVQPCLGCEQLGRECVFKPQRSRGRAKRSSLRYAAVNHLLQPRKDTTAPDSTIPNLMLKDLELCNKHIEARKGIVATNPKTGTFQYYGLSSHFCFVQRIYQRLKKTHNNEQPGNRLPSRPRVMPEGLDKWGMQNFIFSNEACHDEVVESAFFPQELGKELIQGFFKFVHPQAPILEYSVVMQNWEELSRDPESKVNSDQRRILQMVLAIGARVLCSQENNDSGFLEKWSEILSKRADVGLNYFGDPTLGMIHVLLLKTLYALQKMKANEAFMYVGHAARSALALGINRQQVVHVNHEMTHHLKILFWSIYIYERHSALMTGRPSCLQENQIDVTPPENLHPPLPRRDMTTDCAWIRAMAELSRISDRILILISSKVTGVEDVKDIQKFIDECKASMESMKEHLPTYLHFFNPEMLVGAESQEIQRSHLGFTYYLISMVLHRPSLIYSSLFESQTEAQTSTAQDWDILGSINTAMQSARHLIQLAYDVYFHRFPEIKQDRIIVTYLVYACATLLYEVLVPGSDIGFARDAFGSVDDAIQCLEQVVNIGTTTGKNVSLEIMKVAKETWAMAGHNVDFHVDFLEDFPWLFNDIPDNQPTDHDEFNPALLNLYTPIEFVSEPP